MLVIKGWFVGASVGDDTGKVWIGAPSGEGGDFCRSEVEAVLSVEGTPEEVAGRRLERYFWEKF